MKIGFDLDMTLDRPELAELAGMLFSKGCEIHIITVARMGDGYHSTREQKQEKLKQLGVPYHYLHLVGGDSFEQAGLRKASVVAREGIKIFIDDSSTFCTVVADQTDAVVLRVRPERKK